MEPVPTQTTDSDAVPQNLNPLIIKSSAAIILLAAVAGLIAYFVWPMPQMRIAEELTSIQDAFNTNNFDDALTKIDTLLADDPDNATVLIAKALTLAQKGSLGFKEEEYAVQAVTAAEAAIAVDPNRSEAYRALAYAYEIQEKYELAHQHYEKAIALDPENARAIFGNAHAYDLEGDMTKAEEGYRRALLLDPRFDQVYLGLARVLTYKQQTEEAISLINQMLTVTSNNHLRAEGLYSLAQFALAKGDDEAALEYADAAIAADAAYPLGWFAKGAALYKDALNKEKYPDPAVRDEMLSDSFFALDKALALNPQQSIVYLQKGFELTTIGRFSEARDTYEKGAVTVASDITLNATSKAEMQARFGQSLQLLEQVRVRLLVGKNTTN